MPEDFDEHIERQLPAKFMLFRKAAELAKQKIMEAQRIAQQAEPQKRADVGYLIFVDKAKHDITLPDIGSDQLNFESISLERFNEDDSARSSIDDFDAVVIRAYLYQDGSPYVLDGDKLDVDEDVERRVGSMNPEQHLHEYNIVLGAESPPVMIQFAQMDFLDRDDWEAANKHYLSDADCRVLLENLSSVQVNEGTVLWATDFYEDGESQEPQN